MTDEILTFDEAKDYLKVSRSTLYNWIRQKKIPVSKVGRFWRFKKSKIDTWFEKQEKR